MSTAVMKLENESESCAVCGDTGGELLAPEEHDAGAAPLQTPLRAMLLHLSSNKMLPEGRLCTSCVRRATEAYEFSSALGARAAPPLGERVRALRRRLHELTQRVDVFVVVGGAGGYSERDVIVVERSALAAAAAADDEELQRAPNACGESVYQCTVCPLTFQRASELRAHAASHGAGARHSCWECGAQFAALAALREHARQHAPPAPLVCNVCSTTVQSVSALRAHEARCCTRCPACGAAAGGRAALSAHAARSHCAPPAPLLCAACFAPLPTRAALARHALAHRRADRFVCGYDACILRFANRSDLMSHIRKCHSGEAPAPAAPAPAPSPAPRAPASTACPHCDRTFGSVAAMKRHVRVHRRTRLPSQEAVDWQIEGEALDELDGDVEYLEMEALEELPERD